jgi:hypothetical protein
MPDKSCNKCKWLTKYSSDTGHWMNVCEAEEADDQGDGSYLVTVIDAAEFDASACLCHSHRIGGER